MKNLVIVESPGKTKTIEKFLGADYHVLSSQGHVRDIEALGKNSTGIDFEHGYRPNYVISADKKHIIDQLRAEVKKADVVWLASDEDREGEAIAWHLYEVLELAKKDTRRIVFNEITESAILDAIQHPRGIDYNLVNAQQTRRLVDRIVGYGLSPVLWKKITTNLSAGRVQSVAVRLIVEREREINTFETTSQYRLMADFTGTNPADASILKTELNHRFSNKDEAYSFLTQCQKATYKVAAVQKKPGTRVPAPPFTTSSLQQEAARKLHYSVSKTMRLAQSLYEAGRITYMRTDSYNLSSLAIAMAKKEIINEYGEQYSQPRQYHTHTKGAQEAHEAIRPTYMSVHHAGANAEEQRLYELIWKRTIASQMADAQVETTRIDVAMSNTEHSFVANGEVIQFDGFMRAYVQSTDDEQDESAHVLPQMAVNEALKYTEIIAQQVYAKPPFRYTEASLVKKMEELGIGRPSTFATIIETILSRKYVERGSVAGQKREYNILTLKQNRISDRSKTDVFGADTQKLLPTDLGQVTNDFLVEQFPEILSYDFTANEEAIFDKVAAGEADWVQTVDTFYHTFQPMLNNVSTGKIPGRLIGHTPNGEPLIAKITKMGPCIQWGDSDEEKPRFASLKKGQSIFTITVEEALALFEKSLPYTLGSYEGQEVIVGHGKFGPYVRMGDTFASISKHTDPMTITLEEALRLLSEKQVKQEPIHVFGDIQVLRGRFGAYIKTPIGNYKLPTSIDATSLTQSDCEHIIANSEPTGSTSKKLPLKRKK